MRPIRELTLILLAVAGALLLSQLPGFVAAYEQRLGGAADEARRTLLAFMQDAGANGLSFEEYVARLKGNADASVAATGGSVAALAVRVGALTEQQEELTAAGKLKRPLILLQHHDPELLRASWAAYRASPSLDLEFGAMGLLLGWLLNALLWALFGPRTATLRSR
jgi:hypothetical protein